MRRPGGSSSDLIVEIVLVRVGVFAYNVGSDSLFGVGPWLVPLYFEFGVVGAMLGEIAAKERRPQSVAV